MYRIVAILCFLFSFPADLSSQVLPKEGSILNHTLIGFSFPAGALQNSNYKIEIAQGNYSNHEVFKKHIKQTIAGKKNKVIAEVSSFGAEYTWRVVASGSKQGGQPGELHHFSTSTSQDVDTNNLRFRVMKPATQYKDAFVFLDGNKVMYNMAGHPVWFLPNNATDFGPRVFDLKATESGTITFLAGEKIYETDLEGGIVWQGPNNGSMNPEEQEHYHHEFTKLSNGHYMVLANEILKYKTSPGGEKISFYKKGSGANDSGYQRMPFGTMIEYDENGNVVWHWRSAEYFEQSDIINCKPAGGTGIVDIHANAFFFDEKDKAIYISFKNISRILKIRYPDGAILNEYGEIYKAGAPLTGNDLFCNQHACKHSAIGCLFLFNNNGCNPGNPPKIKKLVEPLTRYDKLKKIWEFTCTVEADGPTKFTFGGNVVELPDQSIFVCMGSDYSKIFIVNPDKKILWSALPEKWSAEEKKWIPVTQYRASIVADRQQLEQLIWTAESARP